MAKAGFCMERWKRKMDAAEVLRARVGGTVTGGGEGRGFKADRPG